jgi:hypothetical protein
LDESNHPISESRSSELKHCKKQIRVLQVENECLLNVIEQNQLASSVEKENPNKIIKQL